MPVEPQDVIEARRLRHAARDVFDTQKELVKADLGAASVGRRIASRLAGDGRKIADQASTAASDHRPIVAVGALALTGWFLRKPIGAAIANLFGHDEGDTEDREEPVDPAET